MREYSKEGESGIVDVLDDDRFLLFQELARAVILVVLFIFWVNVEPQSVASDNGVYPPFRVRSVTRDNFFRKASGVGRLSSIVKRRSSGLAFIKLSECHRDKEEK